MDGKRCRMCGCIKPHDQFSTDASRIGGCSIYCKTCQAVRRAKRKPQLAAYCKKYNRLHADKLRLQRAERYQLKKQTRVIKAPAKAPAKKAEPSAIFNQEECKDHHAKKYGFVPYTHHIPVSKLQAIPRTLEGNQQFLDALQSMVTLMPGHKRLINQEIPHRGSIYLELNYLLLQHRSPSELC